MVNLVPCAPAPTFLFIVLRDGAHQPGERLGAPDQGVDQGTNWPLGQLGGDQPNILPLDLTL